MLRLVDSYGACLLYDLLAALIVDNLKYDHKFVTVDTLGLMLLDTGYYW